MSMMVSQTRGRMSESMIWPWSSIVFAVIHFL
jgi:hypothetical protein